MESLDYQILCLSVCVLPVSKSMASGTIQPAKSPSKEMSSLSTSSTFTRNSNTGTSVLGKGGIKLGSLFNKLNKKVKGGILKSLSRLKAAQEIPVDFETAAMEVSIIYEEVPLASTNTRVPCIFVCYRTRGKYCHFRVLAYIGYRLRHGCCPSS